MQNTSGVPKYNGNHRVLHIIIVLKTKQKEELNMQESSNAQIQKLANYNFNKDNHTVTIYIGDRVDAEISDIHSEKAAKEMFKEYIYEQYEVEIA
jgi:sugar diacid utilization regulator